MSDFVAHIYFDKNDNNKLNNTYFTAIKIWNENWYSKDAAVQIYLRGRFKCKARIVDIKKINLAVINDWTARLDRGYSAQTTQDLIKKEYKNQPINWTTQPLAYMLLKKIDSNDQTHLFK